MAVVFADMRPRIPTISGVICDNFSGGYEGMRHLLGLGHRQIGIIAGRAAQSAGAYGTGNVGSERVRGIIKARQDLAPEAQLMFSGAFGDASLAVGMSEAEALLARHPDMTAIFATTDILAIGTMQAAHRRGYRVPGDLSILGYDGIMESAITFPGPDHRRPADPRDGHHRRPDADQPYPLAQCAGPADRAWRTTC